MKRVSDDRLAARLTKTAELVKVGGVYRHYKGKYYLVLALALDESTLNPCVIYQAQYGRHNVFVRQFESWNSKPDSLTNRFTLVS